MKIKVDSREPKEVFEALELLGKEKNFEVEKKLLDVGDVICGNICIERKEAGDFVGSISGRLREQLNKMSTNFEHKYLIIEGNLWTLDLRGMSPRSVIGMQVSMAVRHNVKLIHVSGVHGFAWAVYSIISKHKDGKVFSPDTPIIKNRKMSNKDVLVNMVSMVPGVGYKTAKIIMEQCLYNFEYFLFCVQTEDKVLTDIKGIGNKTINNLKEVFVFIK